MGHELLGRDLPLGATSIDKIGEVWLSDEIGEGGGFEILKKNELYNYYQIRNTDVFVSRALYQRGGGVEKILARS